MNLVYKEKLENKFNIKILSVENYLKPVIFTCHKHGKQTRRLDHLLESGCKYCSSELKIAQYEEEFIKNSKKIHGDKYDYSNLGYKNSKTNVRIKCREHGYFKQLPNNHLNGSGCKYCNYILHKSDVSSDLNDVYPNIDFHLNDDVNYNSIIQCYCAEHGYFHKSLKLLKMGFCCTSCSNGKSKGELEIIKILKNNYINFETEKTFDSCKDKYKLRFDFFINDYKTLIEFNGKQHYEPIEFFGGLDRYKETVHKDNIKKEWCINNNYNLIIVKYNDDIIKKLLDIL